MRKKITQRWWQEGFSLIELLIGLGIVSIIGVMLSSFFSQSTRNADYAQGLTAANLISDQLATLIGRDLSYRMTNADVSIGGGGLALVVKRRSMGGMNAVNSYQVSYQTRCRTGAPSPGGFNDPAALQQMMTSLSSTASCLQKATCPNGGMPYVAITIAPGSVGVPPYPAVHFPRQVGTKASEVMGAAACFFVTASQVRVVVQTLYPKSASALGMVSRDKSVGLTSSAYKILPQ